MRIDSAVGLVDRERVAAPEFDRDFSAENLHTILARNRFEGAILYPTVGGEAEAVWLLEVAAAEPWIVGVVLDDGIAVDGPKVCGRRMSVGPDFAKRAAAAFERGQTCVVRFSPDAPRVLPPMPDGPVVIEALGWPRFGDEADFTRWPEEMARLADRPQTAVAVSNLIDAAPAGTWNAGTYRPYVQFALASFGEDRLLFGSGWPRCFSGGTWKESLAAFTQALGAQTMERREKILGENAARQFGLRAATLAAAR